MTRPLFSSPHPVTLIGGGEVDQVDLSTALEFAPSLVAADGGATRALDFGHMPDAVIGDFDSITASSQAVIPTDRQFPITEQDTTDFDKALRSIYAPIVLGVGFLGARVDHQLAALSTLARHADRACVLLGRSELVFHVPPDLTLATAAGDVVSLYPLAAVKVRSTGLEWPIDGLVLSPIDQVGTSNRATGTVTLAVDSPGLLAMVPRGHLFGPS
ncbi:MAG: thiamine diphosphokinase [Rhodobacteraceae bacterium]|nr:thiamine diphosphokinase [Paracoccaceae bacterium]